MKGTQKSSNKSEAKKSIQQKQEERKGPIKTDMMRKTTSSIDTNELTDMDRKEELDTQN